MVQTNRMDNEKTTMALELKPVDTEDYSYLYDLLDERKDHQNISHTGMPSYAEHCAFNDAQPYLEDYVIMEDGNPIGRTYVSKKYEIGIQIQDGHQGKGIGGRVIRMLKARHDILYANINPENTGSIDFFKNHGFRLIQHTYKYEKDNG